MNKNKTQTEAVSNTLETETKAKCCSELETLIRRRRELHRIPEIELDLPETAACLKKELAGTGAEIIELENAGSSFLAYFDAGKEQSLAFRTDMDALPVQEKTGLPFESLHAGKMHACGHDGHMSILLALADRIAQRKDELPANIVLIFQAGEETPGGARMVCDQGIFQRFNIRSVYGGHLWPMIDANEVAARPVEMMARSCEVRIRIHGRSAHAARYYEGIDAMEIGAKMLLKMYELEAALPEKDFRLLRFGRMEAGTVCNATAETCILEGTLRAFLDPVFDYLVSGVDRIARELEQEYGARIEVLYSSGYPAVLNDPVLTGEVLERHPEFLCPEKPEMISEDFSFYQKQVPGIFFFYGTGTGIPLHAATFDFDEKVLLSAVDLFEELAFNPLPSALN